MDSGTREYLLGRTCDLLLRLWQRSLPTAENGVSPSPENEADARPRSPANLLLLNAVGMAPAFEGRCLRWLEGVLGDDSSSNPARSASVDVRSTIRNAATRLAKVTGPSARRFHIAEEDITRRPRSNLLPYADRLLTRLVGLEYFRHVDELLQSRASADDGYAAIYQELYAVSTRLRPRWDKLCNQLAALDTPSQREMAEKSATGHVRTVNGVLSQLLGDTPPDGWGDYYRQETAPNLDRLLGIARRSLGVAGWRTCFVRLNMGLAWGGTLGYLAEVSAEELYPYWCFAELAEVMAGMNRFDLLDAYWIGVGDAGGMSPANRTYLDIFGRRSANPVSTQSVAALPPSIVSPRRGDPRVHVFDSRIEVRAVDAINLARGYAATLRRAGLKPGNIVFLGPQLPPFPEDIGDPDTRLLGIGLFPRPTSHEANSSGLRELLRFGDF